MKNIPRLFIDADLTPGAIVPAPRDATHYLRRVMRSDTCLVFHAGHEFTATLNPAGDAFIIGDKTDHADPSNDLIFYFAPIKRTDDVIGAVTQLGVREIVPVMTQHSVAHHINWDRMRKIATEAAEQSNRNSIPVIRAPIKFADLDMQGLLFADERAAHGAAVPTTTSGDVRGVLVGPEGGFSDAEFDALAAGGARGISLGATILRAEVAAIAAVVKALS